MLSPELIVDIVKRQKAGEEVGPLPQMRFSCSRNVSDIKRSINLTLAFLNDCPTPYLGAEIAPRSVYTRQNNGIVGVDTAIWPVHLFPEKSDFNDGGTTQIQIMMDAYGDIMVRCATVLPDDSVRVSLFPKRYDEVQLQKSHVLQILHSLEGFRAVLDARFLSRQPSLV